MRFVFLSSLLLVSTACTERQVTDVYWLNEENTFSIEIVTEPQQPDAVAIETMENQASKICSQFGLPYVMYSFSQEKKRTTIFDTKVSGGKIRGTFRCENSKESS